MPHLRLPVLLKLASLFALTALLPAQLEEDSPAPANLTYFQLQVNQSVRPGETVPVQLTGMGFKQLQFRLYRVHDPDLFELLDVAHRIFNSHLTDTIDLLRLVDAIQFGLQLRGQRLWITSLHSRASHVSPPFLR